MNGRGFENRKQFEVQLGENGLLRSISGGFTPRLEGTEPYADDQPPPAFYRTMVAHAGLAYLHDTPHTGIASTLGSYARRGLDAIGLAAWSTSLEQMGFPLVLDLALAGVLVLLLLVRHRRLAGSGTLGQLWFLLPAGLIHFLIYPLVIFGAWFFGRYYFPLALVTLLLTPVHARLLCRLWTPVKVVVFAGIFVGAFLFDTAPGLVNPRPRNFYTQAQRLATHLPRTAVIGAIQAGHLGFFCPQRIVNLDGKVSRDAFRALEERRVLAYARARGVRFISDWPMLVEMLVRSRSVPANRARMQRIEPPPSSTVPSNSFGWVTFSLASDRETPR